MGRPSIFEFYSANSKAQAPAFDTCAELAEVGFDTFAEPVSNAIIKSNALLKLFINNKQFLLNLFFYNKHKNGEGIIASSSSRSK